MREGIFLIIRVSWALGGTSKVKTRRCCLLKSRDKGVVLERVAAGKTRKKEINKLDKHPSLGRPGGLVSWIRPKAEK